MTNSAFRRTIKTSAYLAFAGIMAVSAVFFLISGLKAQEKSIPDHGSLNDCQMCHAEKYKMWEKSGHSVANKIATGKAPVGADCLGCHTAEGFLAKLQGGTVDPADRASFRTLTCVVCHKPGSNANPKQLVLNSEKLCDECHTQIRVLHGKGATGVEDKKSFHSGVTCVSCHMPEATHEMKFIRPDDPELAEGRIDTCTRCHKDGSRQDRARQLTNWRARYKEAMDPIEADLAAISAATKGNPDLLNADLKTKLSTIRANLFILQQDASRGAHNLDYALEIMAKASKDINEIKTALK